MDFKKIVNVALIVIVAVAAYFLYARFTTNDEFKKRLETIQAQRDSLRNAMEDLRSRTEKRDKELKELVDQNQEIIETLNQALSKKTKVSQEIQNDIKDNKNKIDSLWLIKS